MALWVLQAEGISSGQGFSPLSTAPQALLGSVWCQNMLVSGFKPLWFPEVLSLEPITSPTVEIGQGPSENGVILEMLCCPSIPDFSKRLPELWRRQKSQQVQTCSSLRPGLLLPRSSAWPCCPEPWAALAPSRGAWSWAHVGRASAPSCTLWQLQGASLGPGHPQLLSSCWGQVSDLSETQAGSTFQFTYPALLVHFITLLRLAAENHCLGVVNIGHSILG